MSWLFSSIIAFTQVWPRPVHLWNQLWVLQVGLLIPHTSKQWPLNFNFCNVTFEPSCNLKLAPAQNTGNLLKLNTTCWIIISHYYYKHSIVLVILFIFSWSYQEQVSELNLQQESLILLYSKRVFNFTIGTCMQGYATPSWNAALNCTYKMLIPAGKVLVTYLVCQRQAITYKTKFDPELWSKGFDCIEFNHKNMLNYQRAGIR